MPHGSIRNDNKSVGNKLKHEEKKNRWEKTGTHAERLGNVR